MKYKSHSSIIHFFYGKMNSRRKLNKDWHALQIEEIFQSLTTQEEGLSKKEAANRLQKYGLNEISPRKKKSFLVIFIDQFRSPLVYILLTAAVATFIFEHTLDTWVILAVVFLNAFFGLSHEIKAEKAMEALAKIIGLKSKVKRESILLDIPSNELVPGDIVELTAGDKVPADLRIIQQENTRVDEAILTGESLPQEKSANIIAPQTLLGDRANMLFGGTIAISGKANGVVVATGKETEFGKIAEEVMVTQKTKTPLQIKLEKFSKVLIWLVLAAVSLIFIIGVFKGLDFLQMFLISVSVSISVIPEGLPAIITITLAGGAFEMAKRKAITRKLLAVETLGSITTIASDKTGTLTHNQMTVGKIFSYQNKEIFQVSGSGYEPEGEIKPLLTEDLLRMFTLGVLCNDAEIYEENREWAVLGDPTEGALITVASKAKIHKEEISQKNPRLDEIPFDTKNGFMATLNKTSDDKNLLIVKGKIEKILSFSDFNEKEKKNIIATMEEFASQSLRVLAISVKEMPSSNQEISEKDLSKMTFLGFFGMIDPPRKEAIEAIKRCLDSGIRPMMLTGDYPLTAKAVAKDLGIINQNTDGVISGEDLEKSNPKTFDEIVKKYSVYARISPELKLKIVESLQRQGEVVAVTGDGINDAPALRKADIGVAMGEGGTDVSREVSDLVLADNNFATIIVAIEEGRTVFQNIRRALFYLLSTNVGELFIIFFAIIFFPYPYNLPLLPAQILWINLITDGTAGAALALEPAHKDVIKYPPRSPKENILDKITFIRIILVSLIMLLVTILLYYFEIQNGADIVRARTVAFATMVVFQILNVLNSRSLRQSIFKMPFFSNKYILASLIFSFLLSFLTIHLPWLQSLFHTTSLSLIDWLKIFILSLLVILVVEIEKLIRRRTNAKY